MYVLETDEAVTTRRVVDEKAYEQLLLGHLPQDRAVPIRFMANRERTTQSSKVSNN